MRRCWPHRWRLGFVQHRSFSVDLQQLRSIKKDEIAALSEVVQRDIFISKLSNSECEKPKSVAERGLTLESVGMSVEDMMTNIEAGFATNCLHTESRIMSLLGQGFYTIGPAGEELLSAVGMALRPDDAMALHYRHVASNMARQLNGGRAMQDVLLDRARGYTVSASDPVTGGVHCAIGGGKFDFLVTSTLASQCPPAVGRALGGPLSHQLQIPDPAFAPDFVSYVSVGDGSTSNAHFLTAVNLAEYAQHRGIRCPVVFGISDNQICISLRNYGWLPKFLAKRFPQLPVYIADGCDILDIHDKSNRAIDYARKSGRPSIVVFSGLPRRFGHAATDRQLAYLSAEEVEAAASSNVLEGLCAMAVESGAITYPSLLKAFERISSQTQDAFQIAANEPKITSREAMLDVVSAPLVEVPAAALDKGTGTSQGKESKKKPAVVMRKAMTAAIAECLSEHPECVYLGEDVQHGGYYIVTEGLAERFPMRVRDFPPDETTLLGAAMGYAQAGMLPIVEIPYSKYLDCGADTFFELAIAHWLSMGQQPNGMIIRLQGFDAGVFGGNFHTHNSLHMPPGVDVVCYSNGEDYVSGWRYAIQQAKAGRVVMSVDSTALLNARHVDVEAADNAWMRRIPPPDVPPMGFEDVRVYTCGGPGGGGGAAPMPEAVRGGGGGHKGRLAIVTYGNGVPLALRAARELEQKHGFARGEISVVDTPLLSSTPEGLKQTIGKDSAAVDYPFASVLFADVCKHGQNPYGGMITSLQSSGDLPPSWAAVTAPRTYNPLGSMITFLSVGDIVQEARRLCP